MVTLADLCAIADSVEVTAERLAKVTPALAEGLRCAEFQLIALGEVDRMASELVRQCKRVRDIIAIEQGRKP